MLVLFSKCIPFVAVNSIKKPHLVEIRNLPNPPKMVKLALEAICLLLGEPTTDWKTIRSFIMRDNFISSIVSFSTEDIRYVSKYLQDHILCVCMK